MPVFSRNEIKNSSSGMLQPPISPFIRPPDFHRASETLLFQIRFWTPWLWHISIDGEWTSNSPRDVLDYWLEARLALGAQPERTVHCILDLSLFRQLSKCIPLYRLDQSGATHFWPIGSRIQNLYRIGRWRRATVVQSWKDAFTRAWTASGSEWHATAWGHRHPSRDQFEMNRLKHFIAHPRITVPSDIVPGYETLYEAVHNRNVLLLQLSQRKSKAEKHLEYSNRAHRLRADIWKLASEKSLSTAVLIQNLLDRVGPFLKVNRACYNSYVEDKSRGGVVCTIEWCAVDTHSSLGTHVPHFLVKTFENKEIFHITPQSAGQMVPMPIRGIVIRMIEAITKPLDIKSLSVLPHCIEGKIEGWFTFDICHSNPHHLEMTPEVRDVVTEMVDIINNHILQKRVQSELKLAYADLEQRVRVRTADLARMNKELEREVAERKETERALRKAKAAAESASRAKSRFLANVSHEIRTPLHALVCFSEIILRSSNVHDIHRKAHDMLREADALLALLEDVLDQAKIEAGKMRLCMKPFHLRTLLDHVGMAVLSLAERKQIGYRVEMAHAVPEWLIGDELRLKQILNNLIQNAIKFTSQGHVLLSVAIQHQTDKTVHMRFEVKDTGMGIPKDKLNDIFESFTQVDGSMTREFGGAGLGTTIARQLVHLMQGEIGVESDEGEGSLFWFSIPFQRLESEEEAGDSLHPPQSVPCDSQNLGSILLVEDYPANQEVAMMCLQDAGYSVEVASNGAEAIEATKQKQYDLIFMDVQMPVMDGHAATRQIRCADNVNHAVPILGVTAHADSDSRLACIDSGMNDVLIKPLHYDLLLKAVGRWTGASRF